jgi:hypothetical protein
MNILDIFGKVSGLRNNVQKNSVFPIQCDEEEDMVQQLVPCQLLEFPCQYLGLPLTLKKPTRDQIQPFIDRIGDQLPGWRADLLSKPGRKILVQCLHKHAHLFGYGSRHTSLGMEDNG